MATTNTTPEREQAYKAYCDKVKADNARRGTDFNPHPYENFRWSECVICGKEIQDDPFGHNADPLAKGQCCSRCNQKVIYARMRSVMGDDEAWTFSKMMS
jgi:hypothetical protein